MGKTGLKALLLKSSLSLCCTGLDCQPDVPVWTGLVQEPEVAMRLIQTI